MSIISGNGKINMKREFTIIIEQDEDGIYVASVPELEGCHTQAKTLDELRERIREAIQLYLEVESDLIKEVPLEFVGIQKVGSHLFKRHPDGRTTLITVHPGEDIGKGMIRKIINDAKIKREEWLELIETV